MGRNLGRNSPDLCLIWEGQLRVDGIGREDFVDVITGECFFRRKRKTSPDD